MTKPDEQVCPDCNIVMKHVGVWGNVYKCPKCHNEIIAEEEND